MLEHNFCLSTIQYQTHNKLLSTHATNKPQQFTTNHDTITTTELLTADNRANEWLNLIELCFRNGFLIPDHRKI